jgi:hypothetical protein
MPIYAIFFLRVCVCVCVCRIIFWIDEWIFIKLDMYIMAPELILTAYFMNLFHQSVCLYMYLLA